MINREKKKKAKNNIMKEKNIAIGWTVGRRDQREKKLINRNKGFWEIPWSFDFLNCINRY